MIKVMANKPRSFRRYLVALLVVLLTGSYTGYALTQPLEALSPSTTFSYSRPATTVPLSWPSYGEAAIGAAGFGVLATHGDESPLPTASVIKVMTALAVLHEHPLALDEAGPSITLTQADIDSYNKYVAENGSVVHVVIGEQLSEYQALQALLLPSANNIAETLARWAFGSIDNYNTYVNQYAEQLGMLHTTITDPSGFLPTTVSTPRDLVVLGETALANAVIAQIVSQSTATIPVQGTIRNVNVLLGQDGLIGIKTGNNDQDLGCYLFASTQPVGDTAVTIVGVVMDGPSLGRAMRDSLPLIRSAAKGFSVATVAAAGTTVGTYQAPWQSSAQAAASGDLSFAAWNGTDVHASVVLQPVKAPAKAGTKVGTIMIDAGSTHAEAVVLRQPLGAPSIFWRLTHPE